MFSSLSQVAVLFTVSQLLLGPAEALSHRMKRGAGYVQPQSGRASLTQFQLSSELPSGTSCGANGWLHDSYKAGQSIPAGGGPGYLYAATNQLHFGANTIVGSDGEKAGAQSFGGVCGLCFEITPTDKNGRPISGKTLTFQVVDNCPAAVKDGSGNLIKNPNCGQCSAGDVNEKFGQEFHFDIAVDAMNSHQYHTFFDGAPLETYVLQVYFLIYFFCCMKKADLYQLVIGPRLRGKEYNVNQALILRLPSMEHLVALWVGTARARIVQRQRVRTFLERSSQ
ncbi:hypothetical protein MMC09_003543 [Bachmanniomyces sp. S44760]|nr:hypothetical protein [Bachmanniomyces sp. S44760]